VPVPTLKTAIATYGWTKALKSGALRSRRLEFEYVEVKNTNVAVRNMARDLAYDVAEMALVTYLSARVFNKPFTAIPVFPLRRLQHEFMVCNVKSGVRTPTDLEGRKVAVNRGWTVTTGAWARGLLQNEYGVDLNKVTWILTGEEHVQEYRAPSNVVPAPQGRVAEERDAAHLVATGETDAAVGIASADSADVGPLIPHAEEAGLEHYRRTGIYPVNHVVVIKNSVLASEPWVATEVFNLFRSAREAFLTRLDGGDDPSPEDRAMLEPRNVIGRDLPYGISANRKALEAIVRYSVQQKIIPSGVPVEELFVPETLTLE
jgi:hypothetical protein